MNPNKLLLLSLTLLATVSPSLGMKQGLKKETIDFQEPQCQEISTTSTLLDYRALLSNIASLIWLMKNDGLFGKKRINHNSNNQKVAIVASRLFGIASVAINSLFACEKHPSSSLILPLMVGTTDIMLLLNWAYHSVPEEYWERLNITPKKIINIDTLSNKKCLICTNKFTNQDQHKIINPCTIADHLYCNDCLEKWYSKSSTYICPHCTTPINPQNILIKGHRPPIKRVINKATGFLGLLILVEFLLLYRLLSCSLS